MNDRMKELSCFEVLEHMKLSGELEQQLLNKQFPQTVAKAFAEYATLAYFSCYHGQKRRFESARQVLEHWSLHQLIQWYETYEQAYILTDTPDITEQSINQSFNEQMKVIEVVSKTDKSNDRHHKLEENTTTGV